MRSSILCILYAGILFGVLAHGSPLLWAQEGDKPVTHPQVREALNKAVAAYGGEELYRKSQNATVIAEFTQATPQSDLRIEYRVKLLTSSQYGVRVEKDVWGEKQILVATPSDAWTETRGRITDLASELATQLRLEQAQRSILTRYDELGYYATMGSPLEDQGETLLHIQFLKKDRAGGNGAADKEQPGDRIDLYLHPKNHRIIRAAMRVPDPFGGSPYRLQLRFSEYKEIQGVPYPSRIEQLRDDKPLAEVVVRSARFGEGHDLGLFKRPNPSD